mmetsp:Transcript_37580/g.82425  ORF Transcript_37580/g.82425 Transcript_37580/m.82425 type:complete len:198 (+) Transcript_37580:3-596(+)
MIHVPTSNTSPIATVHVAQYYHPNLYYVPSTRIEQPFIRNMSSSSQGNDAESMVGKESTAGNTTAKDGKDPMNLPAIPSFTGRSGDPLYDSISSAVSITNAALAQVEEKTDVLSTSVISRMRAFGSQASHVFRDGMVMYERRGQYGPQLVAGSALAFGGFVGLRRGRIPGVLVGSIAGGTAYANIYGIESFGLKKSD